MEDEIDELLELSDSDHVVLQALKLFRLFLEKNLQGVKVMTAPPSLIPEIIQMVKDHTFALSVCNSAIEQINDLFKHDREREKNFDLAVRRQKLWRVMATRACLGGTTVEHLMHQAFVDLIADPPTHEVLDKDLHELVERIEELEALGHQRRGELRVITIDS